MGYCFHGFVLTNFLNANKTEYIVIRPKHTKCDLNGRNIFIDNIPLHRIGNDCDEKAAKFLGL